MTKTLNQADLAHFTGTINWYRHSINPKILYTDGARHVAQAGGAYWLLDEIALAQAKKPLIAVEEFQVWTLTLNQDKSALLICGDGNGNIIATKRIDYSDFPLPTITLWFENNVIMLPSER